MPGREERFRPGVPSFTSLAGIPHAKQAALLLSVEPRLGGLLLCGPPGSGKSAVLDALLELTGWPAQRAIPGAKLPPADRIVCHHFDLLPASDQACCLRSSLVLAAAAETPALQDRFGLIVCLPDAAEPDERLGVLDAASEVRDRLPNGAGNGRIETEMLRRELESARRLLPTVSIETEQIRALADVARSLAVEGNRADYFAALAARASAALDGRASVDASDLEDAVRLVLAPRARAFPPSPAASSTADRGEHAESASNVADEPARQETEEAADEPARQEPEETDERRGGLLRVNAGRQAPSGRENEASVDRLLAAAAAALPLELFKSLRQHATESPHGRFVRAVPARGRHDQLALAATLRAAMPWQRPRGWLPGQRLRIRREDLRRRGLSRPPSTLHLVVLDASGSMVSNRMAEAKGALSVLLRRAYTRRDRVALVAFRRREAKLLLPPTRSFALARRALEQLPSGGGTPLAAGLDLALRVMTRSRQEEPEERIHLTLLTDGRVAGGPWRDYGRAFFRLGAQVSVVDTRRRFTGRREAESLAQELGAAYLQLPKLTPEARAQAPAFSSAQSAGFWT